MDIVERLRAASDQDAPLDYGEHWNLEAEAADEIERLRGYFEMDANCPCCQQTYECEEGCTFADDCPGDVEKMNIAREALLGSNVQAQGEARASSRLSPGATGSTARGTED